VLIAGHGSALDQAKMKKIAVDTGGRFYGPVKNPKQIPQIFIKEAELVSRTLIVEGDEFFPQVVSGLPGPVEGFPSVPSIDGYVLTAPREGLSQIPIVSPTTEGSDPIYAHWNYGLGKSVAFMSDLTGKWGSRWASWPEFQAFWEQSIRWVMRPSAPSNVVVSTSQEGDRAVVEVEALDAEAASLNFLSMGAAVLLPDGSTEPLVLSQTGPGRYRGEFRTANDGAYLVNVNFVGGSADDRLEGNVQAVVSVPYPREFRAVRDNEALLSQLATRTGGRMIRGGDPAFAELFDRASLEVPKSPRSVWDLLAILAAALFVLDVTARRIAVDRKAVAAAARRTLGQRAAVGTGTVAAWKRVAGQRKTAPRPADAADTLARFEATDAEIAGGIDVAGESKADGGQAPKRPVERREPAPEPGQGEDEPGDAMSRLRAAKRRARGDQEESGDGGGHG